MGEPQVLILGNQGLLVFQTNQYCFHVVCKRSASLLVDRWSLPVAAPGCHFLADPISAQHVLRWQLSLNRFQFLKAQGQFQSLWRHKHSEHSLFSKTEMNLFDAHWRTSWTCIVEFSQILLHWGWQSVAKSLVAGQLKSLWMIAARWWYPVNPVAVNVIAWDRKKRWHSINLC